MKYDFQCPHCQARHAVDATMAGIQAQCRCGAVVTVPAPAAPIPSTASPLEVVCPSCRVRHEAQPSLVGSVVRCPCGASFKIPSNSAPVSAPPQASAGGSIPVVCPGCGVLHQAGHELAGRGVRCGCGATLQVPAAAPGALGLSDLSREFPDDDFGLGPSPLANLSPAPLDRNPAPKSDQQVLAQYAPKYERRKKPKSDGDTSGFEDSSLYGALMMLGAVVWFVAGWYAGYIYFYPPVMFILGFIAFCNGSR